MGSGTCPYSLEMSIVYQRERWLEKNSHDARHLQVMVSPLDTLDRRRSAAGFTYLTPPTPPALPPF